TTSEFLQQFGLTGLAELPHVEQTPLEGQNGHQAQLAVQPEIPGLAQLEGEGTESPGIAVNGSKAVATEGPEASANAPEEIEQMESPVCTLEANEIGPEEAETE